MFSCLSVYAGFNDSFYSLFGQPNTQYDFTTGDIDQLRAKAQELEKAQAATKRKINPKAMSMTEQ